MSMLNADPTGSRLVLETPILQMNDLSLTNRDQGRNIVGRLAGSWNGDL